MMPMVIVRIVMFLERYCCRTFLRILFSFGSSLQIYIIKCCYLSQVLRKDLATLLANDKEEMARIKCEGYFHLNNMIVCCEILALMCELLIQRIGLITSAKTCPPDLVQAVATIIYCANRVEVPELKDVAMQLAAKFGIPPIPSAYLGHTFTITLRSPSRFAFRFVVMIVLFFYSFFFFTLHTHNGPCLHRRQRLVPGARQR